MFTFRCEFVLTKFILGGSLFSQFILDLKSIKIIKNKLQTVKLRVCTGFLKLKCFMRCTGLVYSHSTSEDALTGFRSKVKWAVNWSAHCNNCFMLPEMFRVSTASVTFDCHLGKGVESQCGHFPLFGFGCCRWSNAHLYNVIGTITADIEPIYRVQIIVVTTSNSYIMVANSGTYKI